MALSDFRDTYSWQEAIDLGPQLVQLAEELPAAEQMGLSLHIRQEMVRLPAAIANDLLEDGSFTRRKRMLRLLAMIDLVDKIYPALDTARTRAAVEKLADRLASDKFSERTPGAAPVVSAAVVSAPEAPVPIAPKAAMPADADVSVASTPVVEPSSEPYQIPVVSEGHPQEEHVQPDSV